MTAASVARALRGARNGAGYLCRCPIPDHGRGRGDRSPSLSIADGEKGLLVKCFAGCAPRDVLDELRRRGLLGDRVEATAPRRRKVSRAPPPPPEMEPEPDERALSLWRSAVPVQGTLAERYLRCRGITIAIPPSIRFLPDAPYLPRVEFPAMVAALQRPDRTIIAAQLTYLDRTGTQNAPVTTPRKTFGKMGGGAARLGPAGVELGICEGVETGLSAMQIHKIPVWCCLGARRAADVVLPQEVKSLHVLMDNDETGWKAAAARHVEHVLTRNAKHYFPPQPYIDWNEYVVALMREAVEKGFACSL